MLVRLLGSAAGGGIPQWNCGCRQCTGARSGIIEKRTQCSVAVSADGGRWVLINASPDLRSQLLCFPAQPAPGRRETPIEAVLLTDADLDHILGLFLLRESNTELSAFDLKCVPHFATISGYGERQGWILKRRVRELADPDRCANCEGECYR